MSGPCLFFSQLSVMRFTIVRVGTLPVVITTAVEMALFTTNHNVKVMCTDFFHILGISIGSDTIFISLSHAVPTVVVGAISIFRSYIVLLALCVLTSITCMQTQILKAMYLIIHIKITRKVIGYSFRFFEHQQSQGILGSVGVISIFPLGIEVLGCLRMLEIAAKERSTLIISVEINRLRRIH